MPTLIAGGSLIQSSFGVEGAHNLEAVILRKLSDPPSFELQHYWKPTHEPTGWRPAGIIAQGVLGPGAICQRPIRDGIHGNFEVVVPSEGGLFHFFLNNSGSGNREWTRVGFAALGATGPGAIIANRNSDRLDLVALHGSELVHHWFEWDSGWQRGTTITGNATGAPTLIQSSYAHHLEVIVPEGVDLKLFWFDGQWRPGEVITRAGDGPVGFVQGRHGIGPDPNFELLVPRGSDAVLYWRDNGHERRPWRPGGVATWGAGQVEAVALCSSDLGDRWLQALTQEGESVYSLYRYRSGDRFVWMRSDCIRLIDSQPVDADFGHQRSWKIKQVTGSVDVIDRTATLSDSWRRSRIRGTDLGVKVEHAGRHFLLFGDTHWESHAPTLDAIAEVHDVASPEPVVRLHGSPLSIVGGDTTSDVFDVPLDAFSLGGQFFVFFSSNHFVDGKVMGRSVLTRALDPAVPIDPAARDRPLQHQFLTTFSDRRFINVSVQLRPASEVPGFTGDGPVLLVWGSGAYRADCLRLAAVDLHERAVLTYLLDDRPFPLSALNPRYFVASCKDKPVWSSYEDEATPLYWPGALGELSVRWVPELGVYVLLAMSGPEDTIGNAVWLRWARNPWGPWSRRLQLFEWVLDGQGTRPGSVQFIRDMTGDPNIAYEFIFAEQGNGGGAAYAPYVFDVTTTAQSATFRYTLSTWHPYQVVLMRHEVPRINLEDLDAEPQ